MTFTLLATIGPSHIQGILTVCSNDLIFDQNLMVTISSIKSVDSVDNFVKVTAEFEKIWECPRCKKQAPTPSRCEFCNLNMIFTGNTFWPCVVCTLQNLASSASCMACDAKAPHQTSASSRIIMIDVLEGTGLLRILNKKIEQQRCNSIQEDILPVSSNAINIPISNDFGNGRTTPIGIAGLMEDLRIAREAGIDQINTAFADFEALSLKADSLIAQARSLLAAECAGKSRDASELAFSRLLVDIGIAFDDKISSNNHDHLMESLIAKVESFATLLLSTNSKRDLNPKSLIKLDLKPSSNSNFCETDDEKTNELTLQLIPLPTLYALFIRTTGSQCSPKRFKLAIDSLPSKKWRIVRPHQNIKCDKISTVQNPRTHGGDYLYLQPADYDPIKNLPISKDRGIDAYTLSSLFKSSPGINCGLLSVTTCPVPLSKAILYRGETEGKLVRDTRPDGTILYYPNIFF